MKTVALTFLLMLYYNQAYAGDITLQWDPHPDPDLHHFTLYQAEMFEAHTGAWQRVKEIDKANTTTTVTVQDEKDFAWYLTATGTTKGESGPSNVVQLYKPKRTETPTCLSIPIPKR